MPEVILDSYKADKLRVLARGMGWEEVQHLWGVSTRSVPSFVLADGMCFVRNKPKRWNWDPSTDWRAAGELLEAMRRQPLPIYQQFAAYLHRILDGAWVSALTPALIAQAAFEALEASHDAG